MNFTFINFCCCLWKTFYLFFESVKCFLPCLFRFFVFLSTSYRNGNSITLNFGLLYGDVDVPFLFDFLLVVVFDISNTLSTSRTRNESCKSISIWHGWDPVCSSLLYECLFTEHVFIHKIYIIHFIICWIHRSFTTYIYEKFYIVAVCYFMMSRCFFQIWWLFTWFYFPGVFAIRFTFFNRCILM